MSHCFCRPNAKATSGFHSWDTLHPLALSILILVMGFRVKLFKIYSCKQIQNYVRTMIKRMPGSEATSVWHSQESPHPLALSFLILVMWFHVKLWTIYWTIYSCREIKNCTRTEVERRRSGTESTYVLHSQEGLHPLALSFLLLVMYLHVKLLTIFSSREIKNYARTKVERRPGTESTYVLHLQESLHPLALSFLILVMYFHDKLLTIFSSRELKKYPHIQR